jgi:hypothetical protein
MGQRHSSNYSSSEDDDDDDDNDDDTGKDGYVHNSDEDDGDASVEPVVVRRALGAGLDAERADEPGRAESKGELRGVPKHMPDLSSRGEPRSEGRSETRSERPREESPSSVAPAPGLELPIKAKKISGETLPGPQASWKAFIDESTGVAYWFDESSGESSWVKPLGLA